MRIVYLGLAEQRGLRFDLRAVADDHDLRVSRIEIFLRRIEHVRRREFQNALTIRFQIIVRQFFERYDSLLSPTLPVAGVDAGVGVPPALRERNVVTWVSYTYPFNLTGQPAASVPAGWTRAGLPVGLQIVARAYREDDLFALCAALEAVRPWAHKLPPL